MRYLAWMFFSKQGCLSRRGYFIGMMLMYALVFIFVSIAVGITKKIIIVNVHFYAYLLGIFLTTKRLHDMGFDGWTQVNLFLCMILLAFIPIIGGVVTIIMALWIYSYPSKLENNKYRIPKDSFDEAKYKSELRQLLQNKK